MRVTGDSPSHCENVHDVLQMAPDALARRKRCIMRAILRYYCYRLVSSPACCVGDRWAGEAVGGLGEATGKAGLTQAGGESELGQVVTCMEVGWGVTV